MKFALIGVAGYVAPRHLKAIKETGHELIAALDPHDSVGILDSYFPDCKFFTSMERFDRFLSNHYNQVDYISICSPNYLHEAHCKLALRLGAHVICEKPLVLCDWNIQPLQKLEEDTGMKIYNILQLRLHPEIKKIKENLSKTYHHVDLKYFTPRGEWYFQSWKGVEGRSGGIETNIGIHFFDMLIWLFGDVLDFNVETRTQKRSMGTLWLKNANVKWNLSLDKHDLPEQSLKYFRSIKIDNEEIRFDNIFGDLHIESYKQIFEGNGFTIKDVYPTIKLITNIRDTK